MGKRQAIALRALHLGEAGARTKLPGEDAGVPRRVGSAVVGEYLDRVRRLANTEAPLHRLEHHVADVRSADAGIHHNAPGDDLAIMRIDERDLVRHWFKNNGRVRRAPRRRSSR